MLGIFNIKYKKIKQFNEIITKVPENIAKAIKINFILKTIKILKIKLLIQCDTNNL